MKKKEKGTFGYIHYMQIYTIIRTIILFAASLGIYALGYYTLHTNKSLWTVIAILGILPASKSFVNMVMFLRFKSLPAEEYQEYEANKGNCSLLYESVLTTTEKSYYLPVIVYANHSLCSFCDKKGADLKKLETHIKDSLKIEKMDVTVKVFTDKNSFMDRLRSLNDSNASEGTDTEVVYNTIRAISL